MKKVLGWLSMRAHVEWWELSRNEKMHWCDGERATRHGFPVLPAERSFELIKKVVPREPYRIEFEGVVLSEGKFWEPIHGNQLVLEWNCLLCGKHHNVSLARSQEFLRGKHWRCKHPLV